MDNMRSVQSTCKICGEIKTITAPESEFCAWESGQLIQRAMKSLSDDDRELLISGTCGPCFDHMWS